VKHYCIDALILYSAVSSFCRLYCSCCISQLAHLVHSPQGVRLFCETKGSQVFAFGCNIWRSWYQLGFFCLLCCDIRQLTAQHRQIWYVAVVGSSMNITMWIPTVSLVMLCVESTCWHWHLRRRGTSSSVCLRLFHCSGFTFVFSFSLLKLTVCLNSVEIIVNFHMSWTSRLAV